MASKTDRAMKDRRWEEVQQKAFTSWLNGHLAERDMAVDDCVADLESGVELINFLEILLKKKVRDKWVKKPPSRIHKATNLSIALAFLEHAKLEKFRHNGVSPEDFLDKEKKMILGFLWTLYKYFQLSQIETADGGKAEEALLSWVREQCDGYADVGNLESYTHGFSNGKALLALVDRFVGGDPEKIAPFDSFDAGDKEGNLKTAFAKTAEFLKVPELLEVEEVAENEVDERAMILYLSMIHQAYKTNEALASTEEERRLQREKQAALEASLNDRAARADDLEKENTLLKEQLQEVTENFEGLQADHSSLEDRTAVLEEKVRMLQEMLDKEIALKEEAEAGKAEAEEELEQYKLTTSEEIEKLKASQADQVAQLKERIVDLEDKLSKALAGGEDLEGARNELVQQVSDLQGTIEGLQGELESAQELHDTEVKETASRNKTQVDGLAVLKKNLTEHLEDLHRWEKFMNLEGETVDFAGEVRPAILEAITDESFDKQLKVLSDRLGAENGELEKMLQGKQAEADMEAAKAAGAKGGKGKKALKKGRSKK